MIEPQPNTSHGVAWRTLGVILLSRWALNLQFRVVYPFLPAISRGLGVPLATASLLLTIRSAVAAASPIYGFLADRYGRRRMMYAGIIALIIGASLVAVAPGLGLVLVAFAVLGFAKASFDPAAQAYVGDAVPYARRGRVMGILELPWALAWLVGVPTAGFLIAQAGWRAPFWVIGGLGVASLLALRFVAPQCGHPDPAHPPSHAAVGASPGISKEAPQDSPTGRRTSDLLRGSLKPLLTRRALPALAVTLLLMLANENISIVYGAWLEQEFGLALGVLGLASIVVSLADLAAEGLSAGLVDGLGKRRAVLGGLGLNVVAYLALPVLAGSLGSALLGVTLVFFTFEFSIVALLPLISELTPGARGTMLALNVTAMSIGRLLGSLTAPYLWKTGGLPFNAAFSALIILLAAGVLWLGVRETEMR